MRHLISIISSLALAPLFALSAQVSSRIHPGDRIRISTQDMIFVGNLKTQWNDSLQLRTERDSLVIIPRVGAAAGALTGLVLGAAAMGATAQGGLDGETCSSCADAFILGGLLGAAVGAAVGAGIGSAVHGEEQWEPVQLDRPQ
ncbi:MAG TPA: hypothetical protein VLV45_00825 [Gemmatimonadales bacterium]|nr:hypothetical protein [Gemmatimonadales bacterium]